MRSGRALTDREVEVIALSSRGVTDKEVAAGLGISPATVVTYWFRIKSKLGVKTRSEAIALRARTSADSTDPKLLAGAEGAELEALMRRAPYVRWALEEDGTPASVSGNVWKYLPTGLGRTDHVDTFRFLAAVCPPETMETLRANGESDLLCLCGGTWFQTRATLIRSAIGPTLVRGISVDVTELVRKARSLDARHARLMSIVDRADAVILVWNATSRAITFANDRARASLGYTPEHLIDLGDAVVERLAEPDRRLAVHRALDELSQAPGDEPTDGLLPIRDCSGREITLRCRSTPLSFCEDGSVEEVVLTCAMEPDGDRADGACLAALDV